MKNSVLAFDLETLSPQKGVEIGKDVITAIGVFDGDDVWTEAIDPKQEGENDVLTEEGDLIHSFTNRLTESPPTTLLGANIFGFDLPHLLLRAETLGYRGYYKRRLGVELKGELYSALTGLRFVDISFEEYKRSKLKRWPSLRGLYQKYVGEPPQEVPKFHVKASAKAVIGEPENLLEHLRSDLRMTWEVYEQMKAKLGI